MFKLPILERYIGYEILRIFLAILVVLSLILLGGSLVKVLKLAASGVIPADSVLTLIFLELLRLGGRLIPAAFFFATVMTLGRLYQDQEMTVLQSSGLGLGKVRRMVILVAIPMARMSSWLMLWVYPVSASIAEDLKNQHQEALLLAAMGSGRFYEARDGKLVFYAESSDSGGLRNLFIQVEKRDGISLVTAEKGSHYVDPVSGLRHVVLHDGREYNGSPGSNDFSALKFDEYEIAVNAPEQKARSKRPKHMHTTELLELGNLEASVELQSRLVFPLSVIAFGLLAIPLSRSSPRKSSYLNVVLAVVLYLIFMALLKSADQWMLRKMTPEWLGMWWVVALMLLIALFLDNYDTLRFRRVARKQRAQA